MTNNNELELKRLLFMGNRENARTLYNRLVDLPEPRFYYVPNIEDKEELAEAFIRGMKPGDIHAGVLLIKSHSDYGFAAKIGRMFLKEVPKLAIVNMLTPAGQRMERFRTSLLVPEENCDIACFGELFRLPSVRAFEK